MKSRGNVNAVAALARRQEGVLISRLLFMIRWLRVDAA